MLFLMLLLGWQVVHAGKVFQLDAYLLQIFDAHAQKLSQLFFVQSAHLDEADSAQLVNLLVGVKSFVALGARIDPVEPGGVPVASVVLVDAEPETLCCFLDAEQAHECVVFVVEAARVMLLCTYKEARCDMAEFSAQAWCTLTSRT